MERPTCPECQRQHGPGILCATFAAWEDDVWAPAVATKSGAAMAAADEQRPWAENAERQLARDGGWHVPGFSPEQDE